MQKYKASRTFLLFKLTGYCQGENTAAVCVISVISIFFILNTELRDTDMHIHTLDKIYEEREREKERKSKCI